MTVTISPVTGAVGAEVGGVHLSKVSDTERAVLIDAWHAHGVLFFRDQHLTDAQHVRAAALFGEPEHFEMAPAATADEPLVHVVSNDEGPTRYGGATRWHSDATWKPEPPRGSMLRAVALPAVGGDTLFSSAEGAYETLSSGLQRMLDELTATHAGGRALARAGERVGLDVPAEVHHPVVRVHPASQKKCLYVNRVFTQRIDTIPEPESNALLPMLCDVFKDPELQCRFRWRDGDVAIWDNRAVQHYASPDHDGDRTMHRVVLAGEPVVGPTGPAA